MQHAEDKVSFH